MTEILADYLLAVYVVAGLIVATLLGYALGCSGTCAALRLAARMGARARRAIRDRDRLADEVDDLAQQLDETEAALDRATVGTEEILTAVRTPPAAPVLCGSITTDPYYAGSGSPELGCEHDDGDGHDGRHVAHDGEVEWDDEGETWVRGERL